MNTAEWDIQAHDAKAGPLVVMGALGGIPAGLGVVEDGPLPYRPDALAKKKENEGNWLALDPVVKCFLPGLPRATYMPFPFRNRAIAAVRVVHLRICLRFTRCEYRDEERGSGRFLDGLVERFVGRGYVGGRRDRDG